MNENLANPWEVGIATGLISAALFSIVSGVRDGKVEAAQVVVRFIGFGLIGVLALLAYRGSVGALLTRALAPIAGDGAPVAAVCLFGIILIAMLVDAVN